MDLVEEEEAVTEAVIMVVKEAVIIVATEAVIMDLITLTLINLLEQKVGKTEAMAIPLKILNMKMVGVGEKGESPMRAMLQTRQINNPFFQVM